MQDQLLLEQLHMSKWRFYMIHWQKLGESMHSKSVLKRMHQLLTDNIQLLILTFIRSDLPRILPQDECRHPCWQDT